MNIIKNLTSSKIIDSQLEEKKPKKNNKNPITIHLDTSSESSEVEKNEALEKYLEYEGAFYVSDIEIAFNEEENNYETSEKCL